MTSARDLEILVWAPRGRDGALAVQLIERHGLIARAVAGIDEIITGIASAGCAVLTAEVLTAQVRDALSAALAEQPPWSDFPIVLFGAHGLERVDDAIAATRVLGNVSVLERPVRGGALISALTAALRGRRRQYEARDAIHRRDQFLAMLGHELRNPLAAILLALESSAGAPTEGQRAIMERQARHLARLVDDLLDVARVTSGKVRLQLAPVELGDVIESCVQAARATAQANDIALRFERPREPMPVDGDLVRLEEIFNNLISNALKYSPAGAEVVVSAQVTSKRCVVEVRDTGIGIAPAMLDRVFELFAQADASLARSQGGLGIGLTLVRALVELHHGTITARSPGLGLGSTFAVELPRAAATTRDAPAPRAVAAPPPRMQRVLLIEDNPDILEMTRELLEIVGCEVDVAADGLEGLARLIEHPPDVAFIDIGLPSIDGYTVAQRAREAGITAFLVAVTGYGQNDDRERAKQAGFDRHLTKPVTGIVLREMLAVAQSDQLVS